MTIISFPSRRALATDALKAVLLAGICAASLTVSGPAVASPAEWQPQASERLVRLPANYLQQAIAQDFAGSSLAGALADVNGRISGKAQALAELQSALDRASDDSVRTELQHQFLVEKKTFIELMGERQDLERRQLETHLRLYEELLGHADRGARALTAAQESLMEKQEQARQRFHSIIEKVDVRMFGSAAASESAYSAKYTENMQAMEKLAEAIRNHPMNHEPEINGRKVTKKDYIRQLIAEKQASLAVLDQEEQVLGFMAKLVALDAMALSAGVTGEAMAEVAQPGGGMRVPQAVELFVTR